VAPPRSRRPSYSRSLRFFSFLRTPPRLSLALLRGPCLVYAAPCFCRALHGTSSTELAPSADHYPRPRPFGPTSLPRSTTSRPIHFVRDPVQNRWCQGPPITTPIRLRRQRFSSRFLFRGVILLLLFFCLVDRSPYQPIRTRTFPGMA